MKVKKRLTIITMTIATISLVVVFIIGKNSNCIIYDISMAFFGSAALGFIMSITEYFVEKRKAMEEFWLQAITVLKELRKIKYIDVDAPMDLIIDVFREEYSEQWNQALGLVNSDNKIHHEAKDRLISWFEENNIHQFDETSDIEVELEKYYDAKVKEYKRSFKVSMDSYQTASTIELGALDNAYGNLDFIFANDRVRSTAYDLIYDKMRKIVLQFKTESYHFKRLEDGKGNLSVCATKVFDLNNQYFLLENEEINGYTNTSIFQNVFDDIDTPLEEFRCKIYGTKFKGLQKQPIYKKIIFFGEDK